MQIFSSCLQRIVMAPMLFWFVSTAYAEMARVYGGPDGYCGSRTANGERVDCSAMMLAHRQLPFGSAFAFVTVTASQFGLMIVALGSGVGILIYPRRRPELLVWMAPGMSLFRDCESWARRTNASQKLLR